MISAKHFLLISVFLLLSVDLFSQVTADSTAEKNLVIKLVHTKGFKAPKALKETDMVTVRLKNSDRKIKGFLTLINESTIVVAAEEIPLNTIESITINKPGAKAVGSFLLVVGAGLNALGIVMIATSLNSSYYKLTGVLAGGAAISLGTFAGLSGVIILTVGNKRYKMENWHFYVESNT